MARLTEKSCEFFIYYSKFELDESPAQRSAAAPSLVRLPVLKVLLFLLLLCLGGPAVARRPAADAPRPALAGTWTGSLAIPGRVLVLNLTITEADGRLSAVLDIPLAHLNNRTLRVAQHHDTLSFVDPLADACYRAIRSADGTLLVGQWQQPGLSAGLRLRRPAPVRAQVTTKWRSGTLENGRPVGPWEYYHYLADGTRQLAQVYDHSTDRLVFARPDDEVREVELHPGYWGSAQLTRAPWFVGGPERLALYTAGLTYPAAAQQLNLVGKVTVSFVVDTLGHASDYRVAHGLGSGCDEEALRVARAIPGTWTAGRLGTRAVPVRQYMAFAFRLQ